MMSAQFSTKEEPISGPSVVLASPEHQEQKDSLSAQQNGGTVSPDVSTTVLPVLRESSLEMIMLEILLELRKLNQTQPVGQSQQEPDSIPREPELPYIPVAGFCSLSDAEYPFWEDPNFERLNIYDLDMNKDLFRHLIVDRRFVAYGSLFDLRLSPLGSKLIETSKVPGIPRNDGFHERLGQWINENVPAALEKLEPYVSFHLPAQSFRHRFASSSEPAGAFAPGPHDVCVGKIWWLANTQHKGRSTRAMPTGMPPVKALRADIIALLVKMYSFPRRRNVDNVDDDPLNVSFLEQSGVQSTILEDLGKFLISFADPSNSLANRSLCELSQATESQNSRLHLQYHLRYFNGTRWNQTEDSFKLQFYSHLLCLNREMAKVITLKDKQSNSSLELEERVLSLSMIMLPRSGTFVLVVLGDLGPLAMDTEYALKHGQPWDRIGINPWASGKLAGPAHFLVSLFLLLEHWARGWNSAVDDIDRVVGFQMSHTMDDKKLDEFMFDSPDNMRLSRQYFSVLQLLRIADLWIDENVAEWERFKRTMIDRIKETKREYQDNYKPLQSFDEQVDKVNQLLHMQAKQLKERIARKTEDVKSLRDGLFNATSLREAMKGMALNRAIYVFTAVTIVYTPLGFMTGLWALPILNTNAQGDNVRPSIPAMMATFIIIPILTYIACIFGAWYYTSSGQRWMGHLMRFLRWFRHPMGPLGWFMHLMGFLSWISMRLNLPHKSN